MIKPRVPTIQIVKMGSTYRELRSRKGDFDRWIVNAVSDPTIRWKTKRIASVVPENVHRFDGVILTGAHETLIDGYAYLKGVERLMETVLSHRIPTLGICFGHQIINLILGGKVVRNALGPAIGVVPLHLTLAGVADPLFKGMNPARLQVYSSHTDVVAQVASRVATLAYNDMSEYQATRYGNSIFTTQFHPEYSRAVMSYYIKKNRKLLEEAHYHNPLNIPPAGDILEANKTIRNSHKVLDNFIKIVQARHNPA